FALSRRNQPNGFGRGSAESELLHTTPQGGADVTGNEQDFLRDLLSLPKGYYPVRVIQQENVTHGLIPLLVQHLASREVVGDFVQELHRLAEDDTGCSPLPSLFDGERGQRSREELESQTCAKQLRVILATAMCALAVRWDRQEEAGQYA